MKVLLSAALALVTAVAGAQQFPAQPIQMVIPYAPGGGTDVIARPLGQELSERLKQSVYLDHKPGAGGNLGAQFVGKSAPTGHSLLVANNSHVINPFVYKSPGYDMVNDFAPLTIVAKAPLLVVVHKSIPIHSIRELVAHAKANPGKLNFGSAGTGTPGHLAPLLFTKLAGISMVHVPYKGSGPALIGQLGRQFDVQFATPAVVAPHIKSGELRAIGVTSRTRFPAFPDVSTIAESGIRELADYDQAIWWGLLARAGTDARILDQLHAAVTEAVKSPRMQEALTSQGMVPTTTTRTEFANIIRADLQRWEAVVRENNISVD